MSLCIKRNFGEKIHLFNQATGDYCGSIKILNRHSALAINLVNFIVKREELLTEDDRRKMCLRTT